MRIVRILGQGRVEIGDAPEPVPGAGEVLIQRAVSAICGSEMHAYRGPGMAQGNFGHEAAGTVSAVGPGVEALPVGQRVGVSAISGCGHCAYCAAGRNNWCRQLKCYGQMHADYFLAAANACHALPADVSWDAAVLLSGDGLGVPYHTSTKIGERPARTLAIFGLGPIGLGNTLLEAYLGRQVIGVDISPYRLELARQLGAARTLNAREVSDVVAAIRELTDGYGADICLEAAGQPQTLKQCFAAVHAGGLVLINGEQPRVELSPSEDFIRRDITCMGSFFYSISEFPAMLALYRQGLPLEKLITHHYPLAEADAAYREFAAGRTGKVLLV